MSDIKTILTVSPTTGAEFKVCLRFARADEIRSALADSTDVRRRRILANRLRFLAKWRKDFETLKAKAIGEMASNR